MLSSDKPSEHVTLSAELSSDHDLYCGFCNVLYYDESHAEDWIKWIQCKIWFHESCTGSSGEALAILRVLSLIGRSNL